MIETKADIVKDEIIQEAIEMAKKENQRIIEFIEGFTKEIGKKKDSPPDEVDYSEILKLVKTKYAKLVEDAVKQAAETAGSEVGMLQEIISSIYEEMEKKFGWT